MTDGEAGQGTPSGDPGSSPIRRAVGVAQEVIAGPRVPPWLRTLGVRAWLFLGLVGVLVVFLVFFSLISALLIPLVAAVVLAAIVVPLVDRLDRWRFPRWLAAALMLLLGIAIVGGTVALIVWGILDQGGEVGQQASSSLQEASGVFSSLNLDGSEVRDAAGDILTVLISGLVGGLVGSAATLVIGMVLSAFMLLYLLKDWTTIMGWAAGHLGVPRPLGERLLDDAVQSFRGYARGMTVVALANAVTMGLGAWILGVPLAPTIAIVTFVTAYVPIFGAVFAGAFAVVIALGSEGLTDAVIMLAIAIVANNSLSNLIQPIAFGRTLKLHPLVVLVVTTGGTLLFGIFGAVLAAPVTAVILKTSAELKARGTVSEEPSGPSEVAVGGAASGRG